MPKVVSYQTLNCIGKNFHTFVKLRNTNNTFNFISYKFDIYTWRRNLTGVVFLQYLIISCKISKIFKKIPKKFIKLRPYSKNKIWQNEKWLLYIYFSRILVVDWFHNFYWISAKLWANKIKTYHRKIFLKDIGRNALKKGN